MFVIGALNPQVGNDRRNKLLQQLAQQYSGGNGSLGLPATNLMRQTPVFGTASRATSRTAPGGTPEFATGNPISSFLSNLLGPGGVGRVPNNVQSPAPGVPVQGLGRPPVVGRPVGPAIPTAPTFAGSGAPSTGVPGLPGSGLLGNSSPQVPSAPPFGATSPPAAGGSPLPGNVGGGGFIAPNFNNPAFAAAAGIPAPAPTTSNGLVPLGNGVFYQPGVGVVGAPMGALGSGVAGLLGPRMAG